MGGGTGREDAWGGGSVFGWGGGGDREDAWGGRFPSLKIVLWSHNGWTSSTKHGASRERIGDVRGQADVSGTCEWREEVGVGPDGKKTRRGGHL